MIIRPTTPEENARAAELFAIDFRMAMAPGTVAPGGEPGKRRWGAFDEAGEMMCSMLVTDCTVQFDGSRSPMAAFGRVNTLPPYRRRGCIRRCFEEILPQLHAEGCELSYLYPFSTSYYLQFGYERCVQLIRAEVDLLQLKLPAPSGYFRLAEQRNPLLAAVQTVDRVWEQTFNIREAVSNRSPTQVAGLFRAWIQSLDFLLLQKYNWCRQLQRRHFDGGYDHLDSSKRSSACCAADPSGLFFEAHQLLQPTVYSRRQ